MEAGRPSCQRVLVRRGGQRGWEVAGVKCASHQKCCFLRRKDQCVWQCLDSSTQGDDPHNRSWLESRSTCLKTRTATHMPCCQPARAPHTHARGHVRAGPCTHTSITLRPTGLPSQPHPRSRLVKPPPAADQHQPPSHCQIDVAASRLLQALCLCCIRVDGCLFSNPHLRGEAL